MLALVLLETVAIGLLGLLVAGLLRSHAEILRQLHRLGAGEDPGAVPVPAPRGRGAKPSPPAIVGETPGGEVVHRALDRPAARTLLLFLSSGCGTCQTIWDALREGRHRQLPGEIAVVVVARGAAEESPSLLGGLGPDDVPVVLSSRAWEDFAVPGSPYAVLVSGGAVLGEGVASGWAQLSSLIGQHLADLGLRDDGVGLGDRGSRPRRDTDEELLAAGIRPGDPSLYPAPATDR